VENEIKVVELFAGVGGFRIGLEGWKGKSATSGYEEKIKTSYKVIWSNQWEPATKSQFASIIYENRFGHEGHSNINIEDVNVDEIPDHDLLVGGFPCQDYSVATTLKNSKGLIGKKGVLWWSIYKILFEKKGEKPQYLFLENVDRLLISPSSQRGRDFAVILQSLNKLGYAVEWRVINAAEYGFAQRRRRTYILAYKVGSHVFKQIMEDKPIDWLLTNGTIAKAFPVQVPNKAQLQYFKLLGGLDDVSKNFDNSIGAFANTGLMLDGKVTTFKTNPLYDGPYKFLGNIIEKDGVDEEFYINPSEMDKWVYLKGGKKEERASSKGFVYSYSEGSMSFPDALDKPSRTIITGEGGKSPSRFKHVISINNKYRRLTPIELERLDMFPDNHTKLDSVSNGKRAFFLGNALVVGVIEKIGLSLFRQINK